MKNENDHMLGELRSAFERADWGRLTKLMEEDLSADQVGIEWLRGRVRGGGGSEFMRQVVSAFIHYEEQTTEYTLRGVGVRLEPNRRLYTDYSKEGEGDEAGSRWKPLLINGTPFDNVTRLHVQDETTAGFGIFLVSGIVGDFERIWQMAPEEWLSPDEIPSSGVGPWRVRTLHQRRVGEAWNLM